MNFSQWLLIENIIQKDQSGHPIQLDLYFPQGEMQPPVCKLTGIEFTGKGLICFDFDQTLTTAWFGTPKDPKDKSSHSTANPNPAMEKKMQEHKLAGNKVIIVTARGEKEGQLTGDAHHVAGLQPIITPDPTLGNHGVNAPRERDWSPALKTNPAWNVIPSVVQSPKNAFHLGAVSLGTKGEDKGPFIAAKMAAFNADSRKAGENPHPETGEPQGHYTWGILYDDGIKNVKSASSQQKRGIALVGIAVEQIYEPGGRRPAGVAANVGASGM